MISAFVLTVVASNFVSFLAIFASSPVALPTAFIAACRSSIGEAANTAEAKSPTVTRPQVTVSTLVLHMQISREHRHRDPVPCRLRHCHGCYSVLLESGGIPPTAQAQLWSPIWSRASCGQML